MSSNTKTSGPKTRKRLGNLESVIRKHDEKKLREYLLGRSKSQVKKSKTYTTSQTPGRGLNFFRGGVKKRKTKKRRKTKRRDKRKRRKSKRKSRRRR